VGQWSVSVPGCREQTDVFSRSALGFLDVGSDTRPSTSDHASTDRFPRVLHMLNGASGQPRSFACSRTVVHRVLITPRLELSPLSRLLQPSKSSPARTISCRSYKGILEYHNEKPFLRVYKGEMVHAQRQLSMPTWRCPRHLVQSGRPKQRGCTRLSVIFY